MYVLHDYAEFRFPEHVYWKLGTIFIHWLMLRLKMDLLLCLLLWNCPAATLSPSYSSKLKTISLVDEAVTSLETYAEYIFDWAELLNVQEKTIQSIFTEKGERKIPFFIIFFLLYVPLHVWRSVSTLAHLKDQIVWRIEPFFLLHPAILYKVV